MRRERRQVLYVLGAALLLSGCQPTTDTVIVKPKSVPAPNNSRTMPIIVRATVKPRPIPIPSKIDGMTGFLEA